MTQTSELQWTAQEQSIAKAAFDKAYKREIQSLVQVVRARAGAVAGTDDVWHLHDFLSARRHELDGKYDDRESALIFVFADLVKEGWLSLSDLEGLDVTKLSKISALTRMM
jgi:Photoprotection regulator fluorescence recovery protein